jgi:hypothetical protein
MKRSVRILLVAVAVAVGAFAFRSETRAAGMLCFTAVDDSLMPLRSSTLPTYFGSVLYVPYNIFSYAGVYNTRSTVDNVVCLYNGRSRLDFYIGFATYDQDSNFFDGITARYSGSVIFVPINFVCEFFDLTYTVTPQEPASILRITSAGAVYSDKTFASRFRSQMRESYDEYTGASAPAPSVPAPTASPTPVPPGTEPAPTPTPIPTYEDVTVYLSFYDVGAGRSGDIMDALEAAGYVGCFFVGEDDVLSRPDDIRSISGRGHVIGALLADGGEAEYARLSRLLFEAVKVRTVLIASDSRSEDTESDEAPQKVGGQPDAAGASFVYWCDIGGMPGGENMTSRDINLSLSVSGGDRQNVAIPCSDSGAYAINGVMAYLREHKYTLGTVSECAAAPNRLIINN